MFFVSPVAFDRSGRVIVDAGDELGQSRRGNSPRHKEHVLGVFFVGDFSEW